jgi:spermidine synthase
VTAQSSTEWWGRLDDHANQGVYSIRQNHDSAKQNHRVAQLLARRRAAERSSDSNGVSLAAYVHALFGLLAQIPVHETLMIGCGGGTSGTMRAKAGQSFTIVDINPQSITLARRHFSLPRTGRLLRGRWPIISEAQRESH